MMKKELCKGLTLHEKSDGLWLSVKEEGMQGMFILNDMNNGIARNAFMKWAQARLADDILDPAEPKPLIDMKKKVKVSEGLHLGINGGIKYLAFGDGKVGTGHCIPLKDLITGGTTNAILNKWFDSVWNAPDQINQWEAINGFIAWMTTQDPVIEIGSGSDCAVWPQIITDFCEANLFEPIREGMEAAYKTPSPPCVPEPKPLTLRDSVPEVAVDKTLCTHVMVDLETIGRDYDSVFTTIGACFFDPWTGRIGKTFYESVNWQSALDEGRTLDADTIKWWMTQSEEARKEILIEGQPLADVLHLFERWMHNLSYDMDDIQIWGNGPNFDVGKLEHAYGIANIPWAYHAPRCVRTIRELADGLVSKDDVPFVGEKHNALDDAVHQATYVSEMWQVLRNGR